MGRPLKFKSVEDLEKKIEEYFEYAEKKNKPYTVTGLCLHLNCDRKTLINYEESEEYFHTIKMAKMRIENWLEEKSLIGETNPTVTIFNLKNNFGWKDKTEVETSGETTVNNKIDFSKLTTDQIRELLKNED
jgi:hypothetical protein